MPAMKISELRTGLLVQQNVTIASATRERRNGSCALLFQVCSVHAGRVSCQWLFTRMRDGDAHFPSRTTVRTFTAAEVSQQLRPAAQPLVTHYLAAQESRKVLG